MQLEPWYQAAMDNALEALGAAPWEARMLERRLGSALLADALLDVFPYSGRVSGPYTLP